MNDASALTKAQLEIALGDMGLSLAVVLNALGQGSVQTKSFVVSY